MKVVAGSPWPKVVHWWAMRADTGAFVPNDEIDDLSGCRSTARPRS